MDDVTYIQISESIYSFNTCSLDFKVDNTLSIEEVFDESAEVIVKERNVLDKLDRISEYLQNDKLFIQGNGDSNIGENLAGILPTDAAYVVLEDIVANNSLINSFDKLRLFSFINDLSRYNIDIPDVKRLYISGIQASVVDLKKAHEVIMYNSKIEKFIANKELSNLTVLNLTSNKIRDIDSNLYQLNSLTSLVLRDNLISEIGYGIIRLTNLKRLDLVKNNITVLPESICGMGSLRHLLLDNNSLESIPSFIGKLKLKSFTIDNNLIKKFPSSIAQLNIRSKFNASHNSLRDIDYGIFLLGIRELYLTDNNIDYISPEISIMKNLDILDMSYNKITTLNNIKGITIKNLILSNNNISYVDEDLSSMKCINVDLSYNSIQYIITDFGYKIKSINLSNNLITILPDRLLELSTLKRLDVSYNNIEYLNVNRVKNLRELVANNNLIRDINPNMYDNIRITTLNLRNNELVSISDDIGNLESLTYLYLDGNKLTSIPSTVVELTKLTSFTLHNNKIRELPESIYDMDCNIFKGNFSNNEIEKLSESVAKFKCLYLDFSNNMLTTFPNIFRKNNSFRLNLKNNKLTSLPDDITLLTAISIEGNDDLKLSRSIRNIIKNKLFKSSVSKEEVRNSPIYNLSIIVSITIKLIDVIKYFGISNKYDGMTPKKLVEYNNLEESVKNKLINSNIEKVISFNKRTKNKHKKLIDDYINNTSSNVDSAIKLLDPRIKITNKILINKFFKDKDVDKIRGEIKDRLRNVEDIGTVIEVLSDYYDDLQ